VYWRGEQRKRQVAFMHVGAAFDLLHGNGEVIGGDRSIDRPETSVRQSADGPGIVSPSGTRRRSAVHLYGITPGPQVLSAPQRWHTDNTSPFTRRVIRCRCVCAGTASIN